MKRAFAAALLLLAAACTQQGEVASAPSPTPGAVKQPWDKIEFIAKSWGYPRASWSVETYGFVNWQEYTPIEGGPYGSYTTAYHVSESDDTRLAQLTALLGDIPSPAPNARECQPYATDMPYGTLRLTRGAETREIAWNLGCQSPEYAAMMLKIMQADELVESWGKTAAVSYTEDHRIPE